MTKKFNGKKRRRTIRKMTTKNMAEKKKFQGGKTVYYAAEDPLLLKYSGEVDEEGRRQGDGFLSYKNGDNYWGSFVNDKREGKGKLVYNNLSSFDGIWKNDMKDDGHMFIVKEGDYYGTFKDDLRDGTGKMVWKNGKIYEGEWANDKPVHNQVEESQVTSSINNNKKSARKTSSFRKDWNFSKNHCNETVCIKCGENSEITSLIIDGEILHPRPGQKAIAGGFGSVVFYENANLSVAAKRFFEGCDSAYLGESLLIELIKNRFKGKWPLYFVPSYTVVSEHCYYSIMHSKQMNLSQLLKDRDNLSLHDKTSIYNQILEGIIELFQKGFYLTDLKPVNVLVDVILGVDGFKSYKIWLCDIGGIVSRVDFREKKIMETMIEGIGQCAADMDVEGSISEGAFSYPTKTLSHKNYNGRCNSNETIVFLGGMFHQICMMWLFIFVTKEESDFLTKNAWYKEMNKNGNYAKINQFKKKLPVRMQPFFLDPFVKTLEKSFDSGLVGVLGSFYEDEAKYALLAVNDLQT